MLCYSKRWMPEWRATKSIAPRSSAEDLPPPARFGAKLEAVWLIFVDIGNCRNSKLRSVIDSCKLLARPGFLSLLSSALMLVYEMSSCPLESRWI